MYMCNW